VPIGIGIVVVLVGVAGVVGLQQLGSRGGGAGSDTTSAPPTGAAPQQQVPPPRQTAEPAPPPAPTTGVVVVQGLPGGATVAADGELGTPPFDLPPGEHLIELQAPGYEPQVARVQVTVGDTVPVRFAARRVAPPPQRRVETAPVRAPAAAPAVPAMAVLRIAVQPPSRILVDGQDLGEQRQLTHAVAGGVPHLIQIVPVRAGFAAKDTTVTPAPGDTVTIRIRLESGP
jgi:hypothetical protein